MGKTRDVAGGAVETAALIKLDYCTCALESKIFDRCSRIKTVFYHVVFVIFYTKKWYQRIDLWLNYVF